MTKKEAFLKIVKENIFDRPDIYCENYSDIFDDALDYWNGLNASGKEGKKAFTSNGIIILRYMQQTKEQYNNLFKAKEIGEGLNISSRTASGAMRKLVTDGYVEKIGTDPSVYAITDKGIAINLNEIEN